MEVAAAPSVAFGGESSCHTDYTAKKRGTFAPMMPAAAPGVTFKADSSYQADYTAKKGEAL